MRIDTIHGIDEINQAATLAMLATVDAMVAEKYMSRAQADVFCDTHVVAFVNGGGAWRRVRAWLGLPDDKCQFVALKLAPATSDEQAT